MDEVVEVVPLGVEPEEHLLEEVVLVVLLVGVDLEVVVREVQEEVEEALVGEAVLVEVEVPQEQGVVWLVVSERWIQAHKQDRRDNTVEMVVDGTHNQSHSNPSVKLVVQIIMEPVLTARSGTKIRMDHSGSRLVYFPLSPS